MGKQLLESIPAADRQQPWSQNKPVMNADATVPRQPESELHPSSDRLGHDKRTHDKLRAYASQSFQQEKSAQSCLHSALCKKRCGLSPLCDCMTMHVGRRYPWCKRCCWPSSGAETLMPFSQCIDLLSVDLQRELCTLTDCLLSIKHVSSDDARPSAFLWQVRALRLCLLHP